MKVAIYARYSSDNQRDASIADQLRVCRLHAEKQGWQVVEEYTDHAISGASLLRPGIHVFARMTASEEKAQLSFDEILGADRGQRRVPLPSCGERRAVQGPDL